MVKIASLLITCSLAAGANGLQVVSPSRVGTIQHKLDTSPGPKYQHDCGFKQAMKLRPVAAALLQSRSGNSTPPDIKSFDTVLKDGFLRVDCINDYMYNYGDMWGPGRHAYKFGEESSHSIVRYDVFVAKEDRQEMTPTVCFEFCRTVPNMGFFGIANGRNCYCAPYFKQMAGDSSGCDAVCPGAPTQMCGGQSKSQIFALHMCNSAEEDLKIAAQKAGDAAKVMAKQAVTAKTLSAHMQSGAATLQKSFGAAGDSAASNMMQGAKVFAGFLEHKAASLEVVASRIGTLVESSKDASVTESIRTSEAITSSLDKIRRKAANFQGQLEQFMEGASYPDEYGGAAKQYYPLMYFVDKEFAEMPATCSGSLSSTPKGQTSMNGCAQACDEEVQNCVAFSYFAEQQLCFLMSKLKTASYYTGCKSTDEPPPLDFLQQPQAADVACMVKFSEFEGTTLKPDPSGKCKQCLKSITKADRCYKSAGGDKAPDPTPLPPMEEEAPPKTEEIIKEITGGIDDSGNPKEKTPGDELFDDVMDGGDDDWEPMWDFDEGNNHDGDGDDWGEGGGLYFRGRKPTGKHKGGHLRATGNQKLK